MKIIRMGLVIVFLCAFVYAEDTIQGMYSYTYGDSESLIEARQICKDLALRDAIESYYLFIESSTTVENTMQKEDLIRSITAGYLSDIEIVEQNEEGRTITMGVTATVDGEEIQNLVSEKAENPKTDVESDEVPIQDDATFFRAMDQFEINVQPTANHSDRENIQAVLNERQQVLYDLDRHKPPSANLFQFTIFHCVKQRVQVQNAMVMLRYYQSRKHVQQVKNQVKTLQELSQILKKKTDALQSFQTLSDPNVKIRNQWVKRCRETLSQSRQMLSRLKRK